MERNLTTTGVLDLKSKYSGVERSGIIADFLGVDNYSLTRKAARLQINPLEFGLEMGKENPALLQTMPFYSYGMRTVTFNGNKIDSVVDFNIYVNDFYFIFDKNVINSTNPKGVRTINNLSERWRMEMLHYDCDFIFKEHEKLVLGLVQKSINHLNDCKQQSDLVLGK